MTVAAMNMIDPRFTLVIGNSSLIRPGMKSATQWTGPYPTSTIIAGNKWRPTTYRIQEGKLALEGCKLRREKKVYKIWIEEAIIEIVGGSDC